MIEKRIRRDQIGERLFSFENEDFLINTCSDHSCNLERIIKQNLTERSLSPNEDNYRFFFKENNAVILFVNPARKDEKIHAIN